MWCQRVVVVLGLLAAQPAAAQPVPRAAGNGQSAAALPQGPQAVGGVPASGTPAPPPQIVPHEQWLIRPYSKPRVGVYYGCQVQVPQDSAQEKRVNQAAPVGRFVDPKKTIVPVPSTPPVTSARMWCRDETGEREVDLLANHDQTVSQTLQHVTQAYRLLQQSAVLDLEIGQKRAALSDDLKQQVALLRDDVRKETAANTSRQTWMIAGWSLAGAFLLTTVTLTTVVVLK